MVGWGGFFAAVHFYWAAGGTALNKGGRALARAGTDDVRVCRPPDLADGARDSGSARGGPATQSAPQLGTTHPSRNPAGDLFRDYKARIVDPTRRWRPRAIATGLALRPSPPWPEPTGGRTGGIADAAGEIE